jgi:phosphoribosyl 1,2-cyclic phosphodiesterase
MTMDPIFRVKYWGVTGSAPAPLRPAEVADKLVHAVRRLIEQDQLADLRPGPDLEARVRQRLEQSLPFHARSSFGGNTTCIEVETPDSLLILDCGTGFRELGHDLEAGWQRAGPGGRRSAHVLLSHPHLDHTFATVFFNPLYDPENHFTFWGSRKTLDSLAALLDAAAPLSRLYFVPTYDQMKGLKAFEAVEAGAEFRIGATRVRTHALNHPGSCLGYRLEQAGRAVVLASDHEQAETLDKGLAAFAQGADLLYTEGQYTRAEYEGQDGIAGDLPQSRRGWGHTPLEACVLTALAAGARRLHVGHREPRRDDAATARLEQLLQQLVREELRRQGRAADQCQALVPYEGLTVDI